MGFGIILKNLYFDILGNIHFLFDCLFYIFKYFISILLFLYHRLRIWEDLVRDIFGPTIKFLKNECGTALLTDVGHFAESANEVAPGIQEVTTFIRYLSALLDKTLLRDEVEKKSEMEGKNVQ